MQCPGCSQETPQGEFCVHCGIDIAAPTVVAKDTVQSEVSVVVKDTATVEPVPLDPLAAEELRFHSAVPYPIAVSCFGITDSGLSGKNNEDSFIVDGEFFPKHNIDVRFLIVSDGMGGEQAGEILSRLAVHDIAAGLWFLMPSFEQHLDFDKLGFWRFTNSQISRFLCNKVASANKRILDYGKAKKLKSGHYGATLVAAVVVSDLDLGRANIYGYSDGDARCYLLRDGAIEQLTTDQTILGKPTQFLGAHEHLGGSEFIREIWMGEQGLSKVSLTLCSDGFWNMLSPETIAETWNGDGDIEAVTRQQLKQSLSIEVPYGITLGVEKVTTGDDNVTIANICISSRKEQP